MLVFFLSLFALTSFPFILGTEVKVPFQYCGDGPVLITGLSANVWPPGPNVPLTLLFSGFANESINGTCTTKQSYDGMVVQAFTANLCTIAKCPKEEGYFTFQLNESAPLGRPAGTYITTVLAKNTNDDPLFCVKFGYTS